MARRSKQLGWGGKAMSKRTRNLLAGIAILGLAIFATGCLAEGPDTPTQPRIILWSDQVIAPEKWHYILAGARLWEEFGFQIADPVTVPPGTVFPVPDYNERRCKGAWQYQTDCDLFIQIAIADNILNNGVSVAGEFDHQRQLIRLASGLVGTSWMYVAAHEIGHFLGLPHLPQGQVGLMNGDSNSITDNDRQLVCERLDICP